jgi:hypothetical protein
LLWLIVALESLRVKSFHGARQMLQPGTNLVANKGNSHNFSKPTRPASSACPSLIMTAL